MNVKCVPRKEVYYNPENDFRVVSCAVLKASEKIELSKYGTFALSGNNITNLQIGEEANLVIDIDKKSKYDASYILLGYQGVGFKNGKIDIDPKFELEILCRLMSKGQAANVNKAYPRFVNMVLNDEEDKIDYNKINNVKSKRLPEYIDKVKKDCSHILFYPVCYEHGITKKSEIDEISNKYQLPEQFDKDIRTKPYYVYMAILDRAFSTADKIILSKWPKFTNSQHRCEYACVEVLKKNELCGNTRMNTTDLVRAMYKLAPQCKEWIVKAVVDSDVIYYDEENKYVSLLLTYQAEKNIAYHIKERIKNKSNPLPVNWQDYKIIDGFEMTDEQCEILKIVANGNKVGILTGSAGCVDCDTEFFNGYQWKRIADYQQGDKVLQYNMDGTAELVEPLRYVKQPCDKLWHFETKYGVNQTVCDEHRIVYWSQKGYFHECNIKDIIEKQSINGWTGRFNTVFSYDGKGIDLTDTEIKIMCAVICDGSFTKNKNTNYCRFHIKKDRKKKRLREIFKEANIKWREATSAAEGYTDFYIYAPRYEKEFTSYWYDCNNHQLQIICDNILFWDGSISKTKKGKESRKFSTNVKANADFVQFAFTACGYRASISTRDRSGQRYFTCNKWYTRKSVEYNVTITDRTFVGICYDNRKNHTKTPIIQVPTTDGYKYCFTVPSSMLVLRKENCIFVTGNCGKTSSMRAVVNMLDNIGMSYQLLAPTGVASKRIKEATGRNSSTIHMFLASMKKDDNKPNIDYYILEESSMISVHLLSTLLSVIGTEPNIIFVCDEAQLASISCGNIVQDLLDSNLISRANLTRVFRYSTSGIATIATDTRMGNTDHIHDKYDDFEFIDINDNPIEQIVEQYNKLLQSGYKKNEILILSPYNKGNAGTYEINKKIQEKFNPKPFTPVKYKYKLGEIQFKVGDMVINTKNDYHMQYLETDEDGSDYITMKFCANGDIGIVRDYKYDEFNPDKCSLIVEFDNGMAIMDSQEIGHLLLGYSVACHRVQGAQSKAIIAIVSSEHNALATRNLCYVEFSRAQEKMIIISNKNVLDTALQIQENKQRNTYLGEMLKE